MKKTRDLKFDPQSETLNLKGGFVAPESRDNLELKKQKANLKKQQPPVHLINDINGSRPQHYHYMSGQKFMPPVYLGNLIKIGVFGFLIIIFLNGINAFYAGKKLAEEISTQAHEGYSYLLDAGKTTTKIQFDEAAKIFERAQQVFSEAKSRLWFVTSDRTFYGRKANAAQGVSALLESGKNFARGGSYFSEALEEFNKIPLYFVAKNTDLEGEKPSISDAINRGLEKTDLAIAEIADAAKLINTVDETTLPASISARVSFAKKKIADISRILQSTSQHFPALLKLLGDKNSHRYLILLQNNNEIRPSGGFIGSYAILELKDGYIEKLDIHDVYDIDNAYKTFIAPPEEFLPFTSNWRFRDSNFSQDFPLSAKKARWFLEKESGLKVDTVMAINQGLLQDMLEISGPVQVGSFGRLDSANYNLLLSYVIEGKLWGEEDPKHILKVFIPAFKDAILKTENLSRVGFKLYRALQQKHIMMYSSDEEVQALFDAVSFSGRVHESSKKEDYLSVINISMGGTKSDWLIEEKIHHDSYLDKDGGITDEVTISRRHMWTDDIYLQWKKTLAAYGISQLSDHIIDILGRGRNFNGIKIYVPDGSILLGFSGAEMVLKYDNDLKKSYFYTTAEIRAGESKEIKIKYKLPFTLDFGRAADSYRLVVEKQPGSRGSIFTKTMTAHPDLENLAVYPDAAEFDREGTINYPTDLVYDRYFAGIWSK